MHCCLTLFPPVVLLLAVPLAAQTIPKKQPLVANQKIINTGSPVITPPPLESRDEMLLKEMGVNIPEYSNASGTYAITFREPGEYYFVEHNYTLDLFNDNKFMLEFFIFNTTKPENFE